MARPRAFIALPFPESALASVQEVADLDLWPERRAPTREELGERLRRVEGVLCATMHPFDAALMEDAPRLLVISNNGVGYDHIDVAAATARGVVVGHTPDVLTDAVADLTIGMIVALARNLTGAAAAVREGRWVKGFGLPMGSDLKGKTLAIIGMGRIGAGVARRAAAFDMRLVYHDLRPGVGAPVAAEAVSFEEALRQADFLTLHVDLRPESRKLIGARELALMKPTAFVVNTARGAVVDQPALYEALRDGKIAGAALDVTDPEPPDPTDPLLQLPNVIVLPHIGSATRETRQAMFELALRNLVLGLKGELPERCVNPEALEYRKRKEGT